MSAVPGGSSGVPGMPPKINFSWLSEAWQLFSAQAGVWIGATALLPALAFAGWAILAFGGFGLGVFSPSSGSSGTTGFVVSLVVLVCVVVLAIMYGALFLSCGLHVMAVKQVRGETIAFQDVFTGGRIFWRMALFNMAYGAATTVGALLCLLPGLYAAGVWLAAPSLVAAGARVSEAFSRSHAATKGDWLNAVLLYVVLQIILSVGTSVGVGILVALPLYWLVSALAYRDLIESPLGTAWSAPAPPAAWSPPPDVWPPPPTYDPAGESPTAPE